jgi:hypothetical protein
MKSEKFYSQSSTCFKRRMGLEQDDFHAVLRAVGETETTQENIQNWLDLDQGDPEFQLLVLL